MKQNTGSIFLPSRRALLAGTAVAAAGGMRAQGRRPVRAYAGTYSNPQGPEGSKGRGSGIYLLEMNPATGGLTQRAVFESDANPSWLAYNPGRTHLYSANETMTYNGAPTGSVSAWAVNAADGRLRLLNTVSSEGAGPAHLSVHPTGRFVLVANYFGGTTAVLPVGADGRLGRATDVKVHSGTVGPQRAASAPVGSFAISGHDRTHAHMVEADATGKFVIAADLGLDRLFVWRFDAARGLLTPNEPGYVPFPAGDGPRHFTFHKNGRWLYSLQEEASTIVVFDYDAASGRLTAKQTLSTLPKGFAGTNFTSEIMVSPDGRFVYAANRLHDTIAFFSIAGDGRLTLMGETWTRGDYPRSFSIDPTGTFLYTCNQRADAIACFRINRQTAELSFTGQYTPIGTPAILLF